MSARDRATPGPWRWGDRGLYAVHADGRLGSRAAVIVASIRGQQCQSDDVFVSVREADKPLIAAAPDLRDALRELVEAAGNPTPEALKRAEAALAKAEGGL